MCEYRPSFARLDDDAHGFGEGWRCYGLRTLSADHQHFVGGTEYCSLNEKLRDILLREDCIDSPPPSGPPPTLPPPTLVPTCEGMMKADGLAALLAYIESHSTGNSTGRTPRIAVIGSSGNLLHGGRGSEIDSHDIVMRVNGPVLDGYEDDVGSRVRCRLSYPRGRTSGLLSCYVPSRCPAPADPELSLSSKPATAAGREGSEVHTEPHRAHISC